MASAKYILKQIRQAEKQMEPEIRKQIDIYYSAVSIALHRHWNWDTERIMTMYDATQKAWNECAASNRVSMVQMLEDETGIELRNETGKSWHDICYLNSDHPMNYRAMDPYTFYAMRVKQNEWQGTLVFACILLGMYRRFGFKTEWMAKLVEQTVAVREEFSFDREKLLAECRAECGVTIQDKEEQDNGNQDNTGSCG